MNNPIGNHPPPAAESGVHPSQLGVSEWTRYAMVIDARSPREYDEDHVPGAINLPVVDDAEYAEVGTTHRDDPHRAYLIGVAYSLRNIAARIGPLISRFGPQDRFLVYCFRGGKRSRLWADTLRTIGFQVDVLAGGWKNYRRWVREGLDQLAPGFRYRVLSGPTGCGKTRILLELQSQGEQVLELEGLARHRGSLLGDLPGVPQPTQKSFDSLLLETMRRFDPSRPVWLEAESRKIGQLQIPVSLHEAMARSQVIEIETPMAERVRLWREDYPHFAADPVAMVDKLEPLKPLVGKEALADWRAFAEAGRIDELFESVMLRHYDPCYSRSHRRVYGTGAAATVVAMDSLAGDGFRRAVENLRSGARE